MTGAEAMLKDEITTNEPLWSRIITALTLVIKMAVFYVSFIAITYYIFPRELRKQIYFDVNILTVFIGIGMALGKLSRYGKIRLRTKPADEVPGLNSGPGKNHRYKR